MEKLAIILLVLNLVGCGGGGSSAASFSQSTTPLTPQLSVYGSSFDLSNTTVSALSSSQGLLIGCPTGGSEVQLSQSVINYNGSFTVYYVLLSGNFSLPNGGQMSCNTTGITGTITRHRLSSDNSLIFDMTNINLPANAMQSGWQPYWKAILAQTGQIMTTQSSGASITCKNSMNLTLTQTLNSPIDIGPFIKKCVS